MGVVDQIIAHATCDDVIAGPAHDLECTVGLGRTIECEVVGRTKTGIHAKQFT